MGSNTISTAAVSNLTLNQENYSVDPQETEGATGYGETVYTPQWSKWHGYYRKIPELQAVIDKKAMWTVGKGYEVQGKGKDVLEKIRGFGKDTFTTIMFNACKTYTIGGDFFAEIMRDKAKRIVNLKPLNPGSIKIVVDDRGIIKRYEQTWGSNIVKFRPDEIFHLAWNRVGDEIHGISTIEKCEGIILKRNEAMDDMSTVFHRYVAPINIWALDTDNEDEISAFRTKVENTYKGKENIFIPKGTVTVDKISIPQNSTLNPLPWIEMLQKFFIEAEGVPSIVLGTTENATEAASKMVYLAFQQMIEWNQLFMEDQIKSQLGIDLKFIFPADLMDNQNTPKENAGVTDPATDQKKDGKPTSNKPEDVKVKA